LTCFKNALIICAVSYRMHYIDSNISMKITNGIFLSIWEFVLCLISRSTVIHIYFEQISIFKSKTNLLNRNDIEFFEKCIAFSRFDRVFENEYRSFSLFVFYRKRTGEPVYRIPSTVVTGQVLRSARSVQCPKQPYNTSVN